MKRLGFAAGCLVLVLLVIQAGVVLAETITVPASTDVWIREKSPGDTYENDGLSVWARGQGTEGQNRRFSAIEFNISGIDAPITGAYLQLYSGNSDSNYSEFDQQAFLLSPHGVSTITWNTWTSYARESLDSLGWYDIAADQPLLTWYDSGAASASDVAKLEVLRTNVDVDQRKVTMLLADGDVGKGRRDWGGNDAWSGYNPPRLVLTTRVPEPSTMALLAAGLFGLLAYAWRKPGPISS